MIIPRKYEWFGMLYEIDEDVKKIVDAAFEQEDSDAEWKKKVLEYNYSNISAFFNIGCGLPGSSYRYIMEKFDALDKEKPYDNGLTFRDVTRIEYEASRKGVAMQMRFVSEKAESDYRIVGFAAIENIDGKLVINSGWELGAPYVIG